MNRKKFRLWLCLTLVWLCVIWGHSLMPASVSREESGGVLAVLRNIFPWLTHHVLRKIAHFSAFAVLGVFLTLTFAHRGRFTVFSPMGCALAAAFADETIQLFVEGRSGQVTDIWIDLSGATLAVLIVSLLLRRKRGEPET